MSAAHDEEVGRLLARYEEEPEHVGHVAALADALFAALAPWHGRGEADRRLLRTASLLHDVGWSQTPDGKGHHKESARLISEWKWRTLARPEVALVAQIARYHRKSLPAPEHEGFAALDDAGRRTVSTLAALLRVADALDRTHTRRVASVGAEVTSAAIRLLVVPAKGADWRAEKTMAEKKGDLLIQETSRPLIVAEAAPADTVS